MDRVAAPGQAGVQQRWEDGAGAGSVVDAVGLGGKGGGVVGGQRNVAAFQRLAVVRDWTRTASGGGAGSAQCLVRVEDAGDVGAGVDLGVVAGQDAAQAGRVGDDGTGEPGAVVKVSEPRSCAESS